MSIAPINATALSILQQSQISSHLSKQISATAQDNPATGVLSTVHSEAQPTKVETTISEAMYSVNHMSITERKLELIDRTGKALGVDKDNYGTNDEFVDAMRKALGKLKIEGGAAAVMALNRELGLDKLGLSVEDVIDAAADPDANDKVTKALEKEAGITSEEEEESSQKMLGALDELGLYALL
ncbi:hypothetical protein [Agrobacterium larrymoorei]|uniref:Uncharacterized protein n=1 Tax=Agrobacterium larrymoorei TaxID=160699 RepID=A0A4D7DV48_9HYPH|nr:hypothetical protein [Agrobacterium larrymoorei]QCI98166.1 hypothetical protein CFBP5473_09755 [Agrobacterium larrymoorei]QYA06379.1 hypothetical protein J5285_09955 [Agrobacterium larrymoorei]